MVGLLLLWQLLPQDLGYDATDCPDVTAAIILLFPKADLGWPVPPGKANGGQRPGLGLLLGRLSQLPEVPCESEVAELDGTVFRDENIGRLEVPVHDPSRVQVFDCNHKIVNQSIGLPLGNLVLLVEQ